MLATENGSYSWSFTMTAEEKNPQVDSEKGSPASLRPQDNRPHAKRSGNQKSTPLLSTRRNGVKTPLPQKRKETKRPPKPLSLQSSSNAPFGSPSAGGVYTNGPRAPSVGVSGSGLLTSLCPHSIFVLMRKNSLKAAMAVSKGLPTGANTSLAVAPGAE